MIRHLLGASYHRAKQYDKSTEVLTANLGKGDDSNFLAYDMLLMALKRPRFQGRY